MFFLLSRKVNHRETPPFKEEVWNFSLDSTTFFFQQILREGNQFCNYDWWLITWGFQPQAVSCWKKCCNQSLCSWDFHRIIYPPPWKLQLPPTDRLGVYSKAPLRENAGFLVGIGLIGKRKHQLRSDGWIIIRYEILPSYKGTFHKPRIRIPSLTNQDSVELHVCGLCTSPVFLSDAPKVYTWLAEFEGFTWWTRCLRNPLFYPPVFNPWFHGFRWDPETFEIFCTWNLIVKQLLKELVLSIGWWFQIFIV